MTIESRSFLRRQDSGRYWDYISGWVDRHMAPAQLIYAAM